MRAQAFGRRAAIAGGGAMVPASGWAQAAGPDGPVTIVVPYTAGTGPDFLARLMAPFLGGGSDSRRWWTTGPGPRGTSGPRGWRARRRMGGR
ncbi:hypothetical protein ACE7GA_00750 [Roseomonas sp. CCTCC AB2023176]|uniref:hypothetical protein n=1 Tax=Roseomonas sp. CCTCC AB2023176 TaxID=3342640 RepID=UPI0035D7337A